MHRAVHGPIDRQSSESEAEVRGGDGTDRKAQGRQPQSNCVSNFCSAHVLAWGTSNGQTGAHMKIVVSTERAFSPALKKVASRARMQGAAVEKTVKSILQAVERGGDKAVLRYTKQFDRVSMKDTELRVTPEEIKEAYFHIRKEEGDALRFAAQRITSFHERQRIKTWMYQDHEATLGQVVTPVDAVGIYVPGGHVHAAAKRPD